MTMLMIKPYPEFGVEILNFSGASLTKNVRLTNTRETHRGTKIVQKNNHHDDFWYSDMENILYENPRVCAKSFY